MTSSRKRREYALNYSLPPSHRLECIDSNWISSISLGPWVRMPKIAVQQNTRRLEISKSCCHDTGLRSPTSGGFLSHCYSSSLPVKCNLNFYREEIHFCSNMFPLNLNFVSCAHIFYSKQFQYIIIVSKIIERLLFYQMKSRNYQSFRLSVLLNQYWSLRLKFWQRHMRYYHRHL